MRKLKLYLETSVWNFLFADDVPEKMESTKQFFEEIGKGEYEIYISELTLVEIKRTKDERKREKLVEPVTKYSPIELPRSEEVNKLAARYINAKIIPEKYEEDAVHVACSVVNDMDVIVSWNMQHIVRLKTKLGVNGINRMEGYKEIEICTPEEIL
jgi:predicted nucleic acid-binding protein